MVMGDVAHKTNRLTGRYISSLLCMRQKVISTCPMHGGSPNLIQLNGLRKYWPGCVVRGRGCTVGGFYSNMPFDNAWALCFNVWRKSNSLVATSSSENLSIHALEEVLQPPAPVPRTPTRKDGSRSPIGAGRAERWHARRRRRY